MRRMKVLSITMAAFFWAVPVWAHGDKTIPQIADGAGAIRTKIDITNLSRRAPTSQNQLKLLFFMLNGNPWTVATNRGTASEFPLGLGRFQTIRIETTGASPTLTVGYAVVRNTQTTSEFSEDFEVGVTVYYEVLSGGNVVETVSVPVAQPTVAWVVPVETDTSRNLLTGFAIVNLADAANTVTLRLQQATEPPSGDAVDGGRIDFTLRGREHRAQFLNEPGLFPDKTQFKGLMYGVSEKPVSLIALLETAAPSGPQFATLVAERLDGLRKNTYVGLRQGFPLDADAPVVDYFSFEGRGVRPPDYDSFTWDLRYETRNGTTRQIVPQPGAALAVIGLSSETQFDGLGAEQLQSLTYSSDPIDMSDSSPNLAPEFAFAIRTGLGRFAKVRIADVITSGTNRDLTLEMFVYK